MTPLELIGPVPALIAVFVGITELRSGSLLACKVRSLVFVASALALVVGLFATDFVTPRVGGTMAVLSTVVCLSGALTKYSRKSSAILMGFVGLLLAWLWIVSIPIP